MHVVLHTFKKATTTTNKESKTNKQTKGKPTQKINNCIKYYFTVLGNKTKYRFVLSWLLLGDAHIFLKFNRTSKLKHQDYCLRD